MKIHIDSSLIRKLISEEDEKKRSSLLKTCAEALSSQEDRALQFILSWPSLLAYLGFDSVFGTFPKLNDQNKIFSSIIEVLKMDSENEVIIYLYDQIFVECLTLVKELQLTHLEFLKNQISNKYKTSLFSSLPDPFLTALMSFEKKILENPKEVLHDLTLYLAWDRVCVYLTALFDYPVLKLHNGLTVLKECLIESFQHITNQGRSAPSFFRLIEALYAYGMKEENFQNYTDSEWQILCESFIILQPRECLVDISYLDACIKSEKNPDCFAQKFFTLDGVEKVNASLSLTRHIIKNLKSQLPNWEYDFIPEEIICLKETEHGFQANAVIFV